MWWEWRIRSEEWQAASVTPNGGDTSGKRVRSWAVFLGRGHLHHAGRCGGISGPATKTCHALGLGSAVLVQECRCDPVYNTKG